MIFFLAVPPGCVSVEEYTQLREQLEIEQRQARETRARERKLEILAETLQRRVKLCELEKAEALERLTAARTSLPVPSESAGPSDTAGGAPILVGSVFFQTGREDLSEADLKSVAAIARELSKMPEGQVVVSGHSDPTPIARTQYASNMHLSAVRALAVYHALVEMPGITPSRVSVAAYGEYRPGSGKPVELRRVEVLFIPAGRRTQ